MLKSMGFRSMNFDVAECPVNCGDFSSYYLTRDEQIKLLNEIAFINTNVGIIARKATSIPYCVFPELDDFSPCLQSSCTAGTFACTIGSNGEVRACPEVRQTVGSLQSDSLVSLWQQLEIWRIDEVIPYECRDCKLLINCGAGCRLSHCQTASQTGSTALLINLNNVQAAYELFKSYERENYDKLKNANKITLRDFVLRSEEFGAVIWSEFNTRLVDVRGREILEKLQPNVTYDINSIVHSDCRQFFNGLVSSGLAFLT